MDLKTYLKTRSQTELAKKLGVTQGAIWQWANGHCAVAIERCVAVERATDGLVTRKDLRADWPDIWPEVGQPDWQPATMQPAPEPAGAGV